MSVDPMTFAYIMAQYDEFETAKFETTYPDGHVSVEYLIGPIPVLQRLDNFDFHTFDTSDE